MGLHVDITALQQALGIPVVATALARGRGTAELKEALGGQLSEHCSHCAPTARRATIQYHALIEQALASIETQLRSTYQLSKRAIALLVLQNDAEVVALVREQEGARADQVMQVLTSTQARFSQPLTYVIARQQQEAAQRILDKIIIQPQRRVNGFAERLSEATMNPLTGIPILLVVLFLLYEFVGVLGAQTLVEFLEDGVFGAYVVPWVNQVLVALIPWQVLRDLIGGEYGIITLGVRYAVALILPIVGTFFIAFSIIEDSGYLPRLAMLIDRVFKHIGLNGRAVIPMVLGFGCDTMATIVTRTLETRRERVIATLLLSLAIPCSAQLGVMLGLLSGNLAILAAWGGIMLGVFLAAGFLAAQLMPGERPSFYMELPPLRLPTLGNVVVKTYTRMEWYMREVFPVFILASVVIWLGQLTGLFDLIVSALVPLVRWMGLPDQTAVSFLFGFFRRDYGAAGLYDMRQTFTSAQLLVATTTITLFVPCIAQFSVTLKERGWKTALGITAFIFPFAFIVGGALNALLKVLGLG